MTIDKLRKFENFHIVLWLVKDTCWALTWRIPGLIMIGPTVFLAIYITAKFRESRTELLHNTAVCFWISANSIWMAGEFYEYETRPIAVVLFCIGLALIAYSYLPQLMKKAEKQ